MGWGTYLPLNTFGRVHFANVPDWGQDKGAKMQLIAEQPVPTVFLTARSSRCQHRPPPEIS